MTPSRKKGGRKSSSLFNKKQSGKLSEKILLHRQNGHVQLPYVERQVAIHVCHVSFTLTLHAAYNSYGKI